MNLKFEERVLNSIVGDLEEVAKLIDELQGIGYNQVFELAGSRLLRMQNGIAFDRIELMIDEYFEVGDIKRPDEKLTVYAVRHRVRNIRGIFIAI